MGWSWGAASIEPSPRHSGCPRGTVLQEPSQRGRRCLSSTAHPDVSASMLQERGTGQGVRNCFKGFSGMSPDRDPSSCALPTNCAMLGWGQEQAGKGTGSLGRNLGRVAWIYGPIPGIKPTVSALDQGSGHVRSCPSERRCSERASGG